MPLAEIARIAYRDLLMLPKGMEAGLEARHYHVNPQADLPDSGAACPHTVVCQ